MSIVSSVLLPRSTSAAWRINVRLASLMDSIFAISFGLALRFVVDAVSHHDFKLTGTLVGLWEGIVMLHFLKKMPKSNDPYIAYGVRLFVDLIYTESLPRLALVLVWTALGMVLADIAPAIWDDVGLNRIWRRFRRDLYTISQSIPRIAFFPPPRTVRFSPSREPSVLDEPSVSEVITNDPVSVASPPPVAAEVVPRRRVPGHFYTDFSDTDTEVSFARATRVPRRRPSMFPRVQDLSETATDRSSLDDDVDPDDLNLSSRTSSDATPVPIDISEIQDMEEEEEEDPATAPLPHLNLSLNTAALAVKPEDGERTPTQQQLPHPVYMPPTPSDSAARLRSLPRSIPNEPLPVRPVSAFLPQIPDLEPALELDDLTAPSEAWTTIQPQDVAGYAADKPPTPPAKDEKFRISVPPPQEQEHEHEEQRVQEQQRQSTPSPEDDWDALDSQILPAATTSNNQQRLSQPPAYMNYHESFDDIYDDPPPGPSQHQQTTNYDFAGGTGDLLGDDNAWAGQEGNPTQQERDAEAPAEAALTFEEEVARLKAADEARAAEVAAAEEKERLKAEKEARKQKRAEEKAERKAKEEADELARQKRREEEEAAEAEKRLDEEKQKAEEAERLAAEVEAQRKATEEKKRAEEEELEKKRAEEEKKKAEEAEAEKKAKEDEARVKLEEEKKKKKEAAAQRKKDAEEAQERRQAAAKEEADKKAKEEADKKAKEEADKKAKEDADKKAKEEADKKAKAAEKKAKEADKKAKEEADKQAKEEADKKAKEDADREAKEAALAKEREDEAEAQRLKEAADQAQTENEKEAAAPKDAENEQEKQNPDVDEIEGNARPEQDPSVSEGFSKTPELYEESVASEASEAPSDVLQRVERMLALRAQMVEIQAQIETLRADRVGPDDALRQAEKIMRKMQRQAERRYAAGITHAEYVGTGLDDDAGDVVTMEGLNPKAAQQKVAEKLELLMAPKSESLHLTITICKKKADAPRQKFKVLELMETFNLTSYTSESLTNKKVSTIDIPPDKFADWLTVYRTLSAKQEQEAEEGGDEIWRRF